MLTAELPAGIKGAKARKTADALIESSVKQLCKRPGTALVLDSSCEASKDGSEALASALAACVGAPEGAKRMQGARILFANVSEWTGVKATPP